MNPQMPNRWLVASGGVLMQICLGTVYGWSVFTLPLMHAHNWTRSEVTMAFTVCIGFLGIAAAIGGYILDTRGARVVALTGGILFSIGTFLTGVADQMGSLPMLYLSYGVVGGLGIGFAYITPIATLVKWFPDKRGLITGVAVMGFGIGASIMTYFSPILIVAFGTSTTLFIFSGIFLICLLWSGSMMVEPPLGWLPAGFAPSTTVKLSAGMTLGEAFSSKYFYLLWLMLFINVAAGIALISQASPMVQELLPASLAIDEKAKQAGAILGIFAILNGLGRLGWAAVSDKIGRRTVFFILIASQAVIFYFISVTKSLEVFIVACCFIYACYGGGFSTMPAYAADIFGTKYVGRIYGWMLTAWSAAGVVGPMLFSSIRESSGNYYQAMHVASVALFIAIILPLLAAPPKADTGTLKA